MVHTVSEALSEYGSHIHSEKVAANTRSLIKKHVLPKLLPALGLGKTQNAAVILDQLPIAGFVERVDPIFQQALLDVEKAGTRKVIKSEWKRLCKWLQEQVWYITEPVSLETPSVVPPQFTHFKSIPVPRQKGLPPVRGLQESEFTPHLMEQLQAFKCFERGGESVTRGNYIISIRQFLGWRKNIQNIPVEDLDFSQITDLALLKEYRTWLEKRGLKYNAVVSYLRAVPAVKYFVWNQRFPDAEPPEAAIKELWTFVKATKDNGERPRVSDEAYSQRVLDGHQLNEVLAYLEWRCKDLEKQQGLTAEVIDAWMDYLIVALLVTTAVRQREVRQFSLSRLTLSQGYYSVQLKIGDDKTSKKKEKSRGYPLFVGSSRPQFREDLSKDLTYYIKHIRPKNLNHKCLFFLRANTTRNGKVSLRGDRINGTGHLSRLVPDLIYQVTAHLYGEEEAKATQCHDFRRIKSTWVCEYGKPEHLPLYAEMFGMSAEELKKRYARLHPGALAAQVPFADKEITANELKMTGEDVSGESRNHKQSSLSNLGSTQNEQELLRMTKIMWSHLPKAKRESTLEIFSSFQRQILEVSRTAY